MLSSADTAPFGMARQPGAAQVDYRAMNWVVHHLLFGGTQARANRVLSKLGSGSIPVFLPDWPRLADRMLQFSVPALEYPRTDLPDSVIFAGPVLPAPPPAVTLPGWWPDLAAARTVIHVTQGTWDNADLDRLIGPAIRGLANDDVLVVISTGGRPASAVPGPVPAKRAHRRVPSIRLAAAFSGCHGDERRLQLRAARSGLWGAADRCR
jgi:hypothetical protein